MKQVTDSPVHSYDSGEIGTATGSPDSPQVAFAEATGSGCRTSCIHILLDHPGFQHCVVPVKRTGKEDVRVSSHSASRTSPLCVKHLWQISAKRVCGDSVSSPRTASAMRSYQCRWGGEGAEGI